MKKINKNDLKQKLKMTALKGTKEGAWQEHEIEIL